MKNMSIKLKNIYSERTIHNVVEIRSFIYVDYDYHLSDPDDNPEVETYLYQDPYVIIVTQDGKETKVHRDDIITKIEKDKRR